MGDEKDLTYDMLNQLKYLDMVLKESLRIYPSVPGFGRVLTEDVTINGVVVPAGTDVFVSIYAIHHNSDYWEDPEKFDPERWTSENSEGRDPYQYVPFSAGARNVSKHSFFILLSSSYSSLSSLSTKSLLLPFFFCLHLPVRRPEVRPE